MILSAQSLSALGAALISPFHAQMTAFGMTFGLGPAGYDVRIQGGIVLPAGASGLSSIMEHITMPDDLLAQVCDKSTWARQFLAVQNTIIEPGWRGHLTIELTNHGADELVIRHGMPIAQLVFMRLDQPTALPYAGKYQDQPSGPQRAKFFDRTGGITS